MSVWVCANCDHEYDSDEGDLPRGISAGTTIDNLPQDWVCPECGAPKMEFIEIPSRSIGSGDGWTTRS